MDWTGLVDGGVFVVVVLSVAVCTMLLARYIRRSSAQMAQRHREWISELPAHTAPREAATAVPERHYSAR